MTEDSLARLLKQPLMSELTLEDITLPLAEWPKLKPTEQSCINKNVHQISYSRNSCTYAGVDYRTLNPLEELKSPYSGAEHLRALEIRKSLVQLKST